MHKIRNQRPGFGHAIFMLSTVACVGPAAPGLASSLTMTSGQSFNRASPANLVVNGSFEADSGSGLFWATGTTLAVYMPISGWVSSGGPNAYAWRTDTSALWTPPLPHGTNSLYFGNQAAASISQTPTFQPNGLVTFSSPPTIGLQAAYTPEVTLQQTITGLNTGSTYLLSFWVSGEQAVNGGYGHDGVFGLDITGFATTYLAVPDGSPGSIGAQKVYQFFLQPASSSTTIKFTNWGHYFAGFTTGWTLPSTTELILDDVVLNQVPEPASLMLLALCGLPVLCRRRARGLRSLRDEKQRYKTRQTTDELER
ncbi:MAG: PEP-CTERM sorting domain-containing protein [Phycisphaerae bacterium]|nr:PEP-CTERM sorting domain-containing protein [Phycisphaerae bacterium]